MPPNPSHSDDILVWVIIVLASLVFTAIVALVVVIRRKPERLSIESKLKTEGAVTLEAKLISQLEAKLIGLKEELTAIRGRLHDIGTDITEILVRLKIKRE